MITTRRPDPDPDHVSTPPYDMLILKMVGFPVSHQECSWWWLIMNNSWLVRWFTSFGVVRAMVSRCLFELPRAYLTSQLIMFGFWRLGELAGVWRIRSSVKNLLDAVTLKQVWCAGKRHTAMANDNASTWWLRIRESIDSGMDMASETSKRRGGWMSPLVGTVESECQKDQKDDSARVDRGFEADCSHLHCTSTTSTA